VSSELYGVWLTISSVIVWLGFFDVGFSLGLKNKLAEAIALEDWDRGKHLVSTTYFMMAIIFIPLCIVLEILIKHVDWASFLNIDARYNEEIIRAMYVITAFFCLSMITHVITSIISAFQKTALASSFPVIGNVISLIIIYILTKTTPPSLIALAFAISSMPVIVQLVASVILFKNKFSKVSPSFDTIDKKYVSDIFTLGYKFFILQIQVLILTQATNFLISNISGPLDVTAFNISHKYFNIGMMVFNIILTPLWPAFTDAYTKGDYRWMKRVYKKMVQIFIFLTALTFFMVLISPIAYNLWIGNKASIPFNMTVSVAIYILVLSWSALQLYLINGIGFIKLQTIIAIISVLIHIPLSYMFGLIYGGIGVILSLIAITSARCIIFTVQINKILNNKAHGIWKK
jgi:O-antigen/teichoic acid export membrane protein